MGVPAGQGSAAAGRAGERLAAHFDRSLHPGQTRRTRIEAVGAGRPAHTAASRHVRSGWAAADAGGDRRVRGGPFAGCVGEGGRSLARLAALRRVLGPSLARRGPLRRHERLRVLRGTGLSVGVDVPRLRHPRLQRGFALRSVYRAAARRRQAAVGRRPPAIDGDGFSHARRPLHEQSARHHRRSHRRGDARPARSDRDVRPLSRSQVRSHSDEGLLLALRRLRQLHRADRAAAVRRSTEDAGV